MPQSLIGCGNVQRARSPFRTKRMVSTAVPVASDRSPILVEHSPFGHGLD